MQSQLSSMSGSEAADFKKRFCQLRKCAVEDYERQALFAMLHRRARIVAPIILKLNRGFFATDLAFVRELGDCRDRSSYQREVLQLRSSYAREMDYGFARRVLKIRLSVREMLKMGEFIWRAP